MIGVLVQSGEQDAAREFFELCKTPWEFWHQDGNYSVVLSTIRSLTPIAAQLLLRFGDNAVDPDHENCGPLRKSQAGHATYAGFCFPIYGPRVTFPSSTFDFVRDESTGESLVSAVRNGDTTTVWVGYNLFAEIRCLLSTGQPPADAGVATLEIHAGLLRDLITRAGLPFVEIPPVPAGFTFAACLTHDIDHPVLRNHLLDRTMFGFLYRATVGSCVNFCRRRLSGVHLFQNWLAAAKLPFVYIGLVPDYWKNFDRYLQLEAGRPSTFFAIPEINSPGRMRDGSDPPRRACRYTLEEIAPILVRITESGGAIGLHGLNAWLEASDARRERDRLAQAMVTAPVEKGVRMHWLCFDEKSPAALEAAGFQYDSSVGYNETVGFRAGTTQVYRLPGAQSLLELPLNVMDTAMFYPVFLDFSEADARECVRKLMSFFVQFGGVFTVNWHDRSIAAERWWDEFYCELMSELHSNGAWFATAGRAVAWFQKRRSVVFESIEVKSDSIRIRTKVTTLDSTLPGLKLRVHRPRARNAAVALSSQPQAEFSEINLNDTTEATITI